MDACQWSAQVQALALLLARSLPAEDLTRVALLLTQLGTTLDTIAALQDMDRGAAEAADLAEAAR